MSRGKDGPGHDGRRAWERLESWLAREHKPEFGEAALEALSDVGTARRELDRIELEAVRAARGRGRSWAEIATRLGVTRQSAWERWRDLDENLPTPPADAAETPDAGPGSRSRPRPVLLEVDEALRRARAQAEDALRDGDVGGDDSGGGAGGRGSGKRSRRGRGKTVVVPNLVGRSWEEARRLLGEWGLFAAAIGPATEYDAPMELIEPEPGVVVTGQAPEAGAKVPFGSTVRLWMGQSGGGSAGDREPRRPLPSSPPAREMLPETASTTVIAAVG
ncbi:PASTA domain-containing protein [Frankia sp. CNm7]|uniref:PASTA domain-containing protein n=1 Tax=Frankia nepalensis TaxID=1836974 RepID=A0A937R936_9ACTN|nr:PASTA domain-containing protein [Frankia nepalensis]MBL7496917.1 PASTA domain-containing protein [Frankia nepalensis]MBL7508322.1 PASTA domain-containing protein [Frankia nepalensis]MBL7524416.1 PASTA domain-containing protein [Frankia nepalensis]MBL7626150.1 PASTA domain-containing protein [Frankia nepalensis]